MTKCLYCLRTDRVFSSEEHTIPRGLGNEEIVLPVGVVCDACNNEVLSGLDSVLLEFTPIKFQRSFQGVKSRKGKSTILKTPGFHMSHIAENHIQINVLDNSKTVTDMEDTSFKLNMLSSRKMTPEYTKMIARALYKIGLGVVYKDLGEEVAYSTRFDEVREIVLGKKDFQGQLFFLKHPTDLESSGVQHWDLKDEEGTISFFRFYYFGIEIFYEMERRVFEIPKVFAKDKIDVISF